jgi:peptidoglycan/LPS O-acetylase OafA/YrhL
MSNGYLAVTLFFMLSGFILAYNYRGQIETRNQAFRFWEARLARIWPVYVFSLLCCSFPLSDIPRFPLALATLCMVQAWNPFHPEYCELWNFVCWSLSVEAFFYLIFPWLQKSLEKLRLAYLSLAGLFIVLVGALCNTPFYSFSNRYSGLWFYIPVPLIQLPTFIVGVILGNLILGSSNTAATFDSPRGRSLTILRLAAHGLVASCRRIPILTWSGFLASLLVFCTATGHTEGLVIPAFAVLLFGLATEDSLLSSFLSTRLLILGGEISYSMYLLRTPLQKFVILHPALHNNWIFDYLYIPLAVIPFSLFSYYCIEGPSRRGLRRIFARLQNRQY